MWDSQGTRTQAGETKSKPEWFQKSEVTGLEALFPLAIFPSRGHCQGELGHTLVCYPVSFVYYENRDNDQSSLSSEDWGHSFRNRLYKHKENDFPASPQDPIYMYARHH